MPEGAGNRGPAVAQSSMTWPGSIRTTTRSTADLDRTVRIFGRYSCPSTVTTRPVVTIAGCQQNR